MKQNQMARPTDYSEEILTKSQEYLNNLPKDEAVHSIEGLAEYLGITRPTIYDWESQAEKKEFSYIVEQVRQKQAKQLVNKGLKGEYNSSIAKVMMSKHGYAEKQEIDHTTKGEKIENSPLISQLAEQLNALHRGTSVASDGTEASSLGTKTQS